MELISYKYNVRCCNMLTLFQTNYSDGKKVIAETRKEITDCIKHTSPWQKNGLNKDYLESHLNWSSLVSLFVF